GGIRNDSMKKFGTPIGAGPGSANENVGFDGVGTPPGPIVGGALTVAGLCLCDFALAGPEVAPWCEPGWAEPPELCGGPDLLDPDLEVEVEPLLELGLGELVEVVGVLLVLVGVVLELVVVVPVVLVVVVVGVVTVGVVGVVTVGVGA